MNRSESRYFYTAERMSNALLSLLLEKDFEFITVKELCARAKVNRSTFYLHYDNIVDLLKETVAMIHARFQRSLPQTELSDSAISTLPLEDLFFITDRWLLPYLDFVRENSCIYKAIHTQMDVFQVDHAYGQFFQHIFSPILSRHGVAENEHGYIMEFYRQGLVAVLMKWVENGCSESPRQIAGIIKWCVGENSR